MARVVGDNISGEQTTRYLSSSRGSHYHQSENMSAISTSYFDGEETSETLSLPSCLRLKMMNDKMWRTH